VPLVVDPSIYEHTLKVSSKQVNARPLFWGSLVHAGGARAPKGDFRMRSITFRMRCMTWNIAFADRVVVHARYSCGECGYDARGAESRRSD
jgi:hypothetical protein